MSWRTLVCSVFFVAASVAGVACQDKGKENPAPGQPSAKPDGESWTPPERPTEAGPLTLPEAGPSSASPKATKQGWKKNDGWNKKAPDAGYAGADFGQGGYVGDWNELTSHPARNAGALKAFKPSCNGPFVIEAGAAQVVDDCSTAVPQYDKLCDNAYEKIRSLCDQACRKLLPQCGHSHIGPHVYMEWGCVQGDESDDTVQPVPHEICQRYEYCTCSATE